MFLAYLCLFMLKIKRTEIGKPFIIYWESDDVFCRVPFTSYSMMTVVWRRSLIFSTCQLLSIKIHVVQIIRLIVQPLNFLKLITLIKFMKGIFMYFNCHNQHYFLFSNNTMGKPELKHTFFSCTVSLSFLVTENKLCCYSRFFFHWKIVYGCSVVESALFQMLSLL